MLTAGEIRGTIDRGGRIHGGPKNPRGGPCALLPVYAAAAHRPKPPPPPPARSLLEGVELYSVDAPHSQVSFIVPWMGISKVRGSFQDFLGSIAFDSLDLTRSSFTVIIQAKSINTGFEMRDKDLRGNEFFAVDTFPTIVFTSQEVAKTGDGYLLRGPLTIHGVTKEIEIPFVFNGHIKDAAGDDRIGFEGHLTLKRKDYGIVGPARSTSCWTRGSSSARTSTFRSPSKVGSLRCMTLCAIRFR